MNERLPPSSTSAQHAESLSAKGIVARTLAAVHAVCFPCLMTESELDLTTVLDALRALEADVNVVRAWGRCTRCDEKNRTVLFIR